MTQPEPKRIRDAHGRVPPLTDAQIKTIDLNNPPPFVKVLKDLSETRSIVSDSQPGIGVWIYRPDWGDTAAIFDRRHNFGVVSNGYTANYMNGYVRPGEQQKAQSVLRSPLAADFIKNIVHMMCEIKVATKYELECLTLDVSNFPLNDDFHCDGTKGFRVFTALEHGNPIFPYATLAKEKGFAMQQRNELTRPSDALAAGIPLVTPALGDLCFFRGIGLSQRLGGELGWHAAHKIPQKPAYSRSTLKADFIT